jgi:sulfur-carrier protein
MIRVILPFHLRTLAKVPGEIMIDAGAAPTIASVLDELEKQYPVLRGAIRDFQTGRRRSLLRFFACQDDWSHEPMATMLPAAVIEGKEPFMIIGAMAGG